MDKIKDLDEKGLSQLSHASIQYLFPEYANSITVQPIKEDTVANKYKCTYCNRNDFKRQPDLSKHMKVCGKKVEMEKEILILKQKNNELTVYNENLLKDKENLNNDKEKLHNDKEILNKDKDKFADMAITNNNLVKTSISAIKYFITNFKDTPPLKPIEDLSTMQLDYVDDTTFISELLSMYRNEKLAAYIGDYIVNIYKTTDSSKQALWSSDVDRLTYIISEAVVKNKTTWVTDKKGIKVGERVVKPTLDYIKPLLNKFIINCRNKIVTENLSDKEQMTIIEYQRLASQITMLIDNKILEKDIIKYIAPLLYWNKNTLLKSSKIKEIEYISKNKHYKRNQPTSSKPSKDIKLFSKPKSNKYIKQYKKRDDTLYEGEEDSEDELVTDSEVELVTDSEEELVTDSEEPVYSDSE